MDPSGSHPTLIQSHTYNHLANELVKTCCAYHLRRSPSAPLAKCRVVTPCVPLQFTISTERLKATLSRRSTKAGCGFLDGWLDVFSKRLVNLRIVGVRQLLCLPCDRDYPAGGAWRHPCFSHRPKSSCARGCSGRNMFERNMSLQAAK